jgi:thermitase
MQPRAPEKRSVVTIVALSAVVLAATLLLTLRAAAATRPSSAQSSGSPAVNAAVGGAGPIEQVEYTAYNYEVVGPVLSRPTTGFVGTWQILNKGTVVTMVVNDKTALKGFNNVPPKVNTWVEAKVKQQADGSLLAVKFRPNRFNSGEIVARLSPTAVLTQVLQTYRPYRLTPVESLLSLGRIYRFAISKNLDEAEVAAVLAADKTNFLWAEVNYVSQIPVANPYRTWKWGSGDDTGYINQTALEQVDLSPVQGVYSGTNVVVAVLDTGIDASHPALAGRVLPGFDWVSQDAIPQDGPEPGEPNGSAQGHGTHVSGIVALVAAESKILPVRVLDADGRGNTFVLAYAIDWAVANGASIINLSLGCDGDATVLQEAIERAQSQGVLVTAAAGNDNSTTPQYPAAYPGVVAVTAVDEANHKAEFANYGADWIDLAAPGVAITSTIPVSGSILYATWSGTSMAVPFVSGAAALLRHQYPSAQPAQLTDIMVQSGSDLNSLNPGYVGALGRMVDINASLVGTAQPTLKPTATPTLEPTATPTATPSALPSLEPTAAPTIEPTPTVAPTEAQVVTDPVAPTPLPTVTPTATPTATPAARETIAPLPTGDVPTPAATPTIEPTLPPPPVVTEQPPMPPGATVTPTATATLEPTPAATVTGIIVEQRSYLFMPALSR